MASCRCSIVQESGGSNAFIYDTGVEDVHAGYIEDKGAPLKHKVFLVKSLCYMLVGLETAEEGQSHGDCSST